MLMLMAIPSFLPVMDSPLRAAAPVPRSAELFLMSHRKKPKRRTGDASPYLPATSHKKTKSAWRHDSAVEMSASAVVPALQTDRLPAPVDGQRIPTGCAYASSRGTAPIN